MPSLGGYAIALLGSSQALEKLKMRCLQMITVNQKKFAFPVHPVSFPTAQNH